MAKTNVRGSQIADGANGVDLTVDVFGTLPVANGGTAGTTAAVARANLDVPSNTEVGDTTTDFVAAFNTAIA